MSDQGQPMSDITEHPEISYGRADPQRAKYGKWGMENTSQMVVLQTMEDGKQIGVTCFSVHVCPSLPSLCLEGLLRY
eukprot:7524906-Pyramimonas_sp.AAC.1